MWFLWFAQTVCGMGIKQAHGVPQTSNQRGVQRQQGPCSLDIEPMAKAWSLGAMGRGKEEWAYKEKRGRFSTGQTHLAALSKSNCISWTSILQSKNHLQVHRKILFAF